MKNSIGIIGYGNMGKAIGERLKRKYNICCFDKDRNKTRALLGIEVADNVRDLLNKVETVILAVKPQDFDNLLDEVKDYITEKLVISIAAGITTGYIEKSLGDVKVVRVMPNIGVRIGEAESILCKGKNSEDKDLNFTKKLFGHLGKTWVMQEEMIDAATAISGSGPAYIYYDMEINKIDPLDVPKEIEKKYIEHLRKAAEGVGFNYQTAVDLAVSTTASSLHLAAATRVSPAELRKQVTSGGGTTEAALEILAKGSSWQEAAKAALKRARELSKKE